MENDKDDDLMRELSKYAPSDLDGAEPHGPCPICHPQFDVGDVIRLNSGGPEMTVVDVSPDGDELVAEWQGRKSIQSHVFPVVCVYLVCGAKSEW